MIRPILKTYDEALTEMVRSFWGELGSEPDLVEGSVELAFLSAVAFQVADLSARADKGIQRAVPEAIFSAFGFARAPATAGALTLRFVTPLPAVRPILIPLGTRAATGDNVVFQTTSDAVIPTGELSTDVQAVAITPGLGGNVGAGVVTRLASNIPFVSSVSNVSPGAGGRDSETLLEQKIRFAGYIRELDTSTLEAIASGLVQLRSGSGERLDQVVVADGEYDAAIHPGVLRYYAYKQGGVSATLATALLGYVRKNKAGGVQVQPGTLTTTRIDVTGSVRAAEANTVAFVREAVSTYFRQLVIGEKFSRENLIAVMKNAHPGVIEPTLDAPLTDVPAATYEKLEAGNVTITEEAA